MTWGTRFRRRERLVESLWGIPVLGAVLGGLLGGVVSLVDEHLGLPSAWHYTPSTASALVTAIVGATAALIGFVVTVTVLVVQMASGTFSARILRLWYRDRLLKATLAVLAGTLTMSFSLLRRIDEHFVPDIGVTLSGALISVGLLLFIVFFDRCIRLLRPVAVAAEVAPSGSIDVRRDRAAGRSGRYPMGRRQNAGGPGIRGAGNARGAIQAVDPDGLVKWAHVHDAELVLPHPVGDFVHAGGELVRVFGHGVDSTAVGELEGMVALGDERTFAEDPAFALRVMVDIANRALSPAVNDPTTAVQVIDHIGEVLKVIGGTDLESRAEKSEGASRAVVVLAARRWEDFVTLAFTEIREYGATSVQVVRRLRALLGELLGTVRPEHRAAIAEELRRLDATIVQSWTNSIDFDLASTADRQGIGGPPHDTVVR